MLPLLVAFLGKACVWKSYSFCGSSENIYDWDMTTRFDICSFQCLHACFAQLLMVAMEGQYLSIKEGATSAAEKRYQFSNRRTGPGGGVN